MKQFLKIALTAVAIIACTASFAARDKHKTLTGSGNIVSKVIEINNDYTTILAMTGVEVVMNESQDNIVNIQADDNVIEWVVCEVKDNILEVCVRKPNCTSYSNLNVRVNIPKNEKLSRIESRSAASVKIGPILNSGDKLFIRANSAASVMINRSLREDVSIDASSSANVQGSFRCSRLTAKATSAADINASILARKVSLWASSSGEVELNGAATQITAEATSSGRILCSRLSAQNAVAMATSSGKITLDCYEFLNTKASSSGDIISTNSSAKTAIAEASSGGSIKLNCSGSLNAKASSGGDVRYTGSCSLMESDTASGGSIKKF